MYVGQIVPVSGYRLLQHLVLDENFVELLQPNPAALSALPKSPLSPSLPISSPIFPLWPQGGSAASEGRILVGDRVLEVDGNRLDNLRNDVAMEFLKKTGHTVQLKLARCVR